MIKLVLLRHGESTYNKQNRFSGWTDVPLTSKGRQQAREAGRTLKKAGFRFDVVFTSFQKKATKTTSIVLNEMRLKIPVCKSWMLNERHYGALQGLNKAEMSKKYGEEQVHLWRRSYDIRPPALKKTDRRYPGNQKKYMGISKSKLPLTESLKDTVGRLMPYWKKEIVPKLKGGKKVLISAHGNTLRALVKYLDKIPNSKITSFNIPTGTPLVYELNNNLKPIRHYFLGDKKKIEKEIKRVAEQAKVKK